MAESGLRRQLAKPNTIERTIREVFHLRLPERDATARPNIDLLSG